jgi:DNA-binding PadR family transcriptional regulator
VGPLDTCMLGLLCRVHRHYQRDNCAPLDRVQLVQDSGYTPSLVRAVLRSLEIRGFIETAKNNRRDLYHVTRKGWKKMKKNKKKEKELATKIKKSKKVKKDLDEKVKSTSTKVKKSKKVKEEKPKKEKVKKSKKQKKLVIPDASARDGQLREFLYAQFEECEKDRSLLPHKISRHLIEKFDGQISDNTIRKYLHDWRHRDFN